jgi:GT2 family glycosyltransferase
VKVTVAIVTYRWARALPHSLTSVDSQTRKPEEEVIALKPSGDSSEEVMRSFSSQLPIKLVVQEKLHRCRPDGNRQRQGETLYFFSTTTQ